MACSEYGSGTRTGLLAACLASLYIIGRAAASFALDVLDTLLIDPLRWLFHPEHSIELELRRLDRITRESLHLERDKPKRAFVERQRSHKEFFGTRGYMAPYAL